MVVSRQDWVEQFANLLNKAQSDNGVEIAGDIKEMMDKTIKKRCVRIAGAVSARTYLKLGGTPSTGLHLTGSYMYLQLRPIGDRVVTLHIDVVTLDGRQARITLSTLYSTPHASGMGVRAPLLTKPTDTQATPTTDWTVVCVDLPALISLNPSLRSSGISHVRGLRICSNVVIRGAVLSNTVYEEGMLPRTLSLPVPVNETWGGRYGWSWVPEEPKNKEGDVSVPTSVIKKEKDSAGVSSGPSKRYEKRHYSISSALGSDMHAIQASPDQENKQINMINVAAQVLGHFGKTATNTHVPTHTNTSVNVNTSMNTVEKRPRKIRETSSVTDNATTENSHVNMNTTIDKSSQSKIIGRRGSHGELEGVGITVTNTNKGASRPRISQTFLMHPSPAVTLSRVMGYTGAKGEGRGAVAWTGYDGYVAFPSNNNVVLVQPPTHDKKDELDTADHQLLTGHTSPVTHLELSSGGDLLASGEGGGGYGEALIRLWDCQARKCVGHLLAHVNGLQSMCFSPDDRLLCTVGGDAQRRTQLMIWNVSCLLAARRAGGSQITLAMSIVARQLSDFPISRIRFSPFERLRLVSCGRENVRFWRIKRRCMPACPAVLNEFARNTECTDLAYDSRYGMAAGGGTEPVVYVSTKAGTIMQVGYQTRTLLCVLRLHDSAIRSLAVHEGFAATASDDCWLRLWPLDFSDYLMEAKHESPVAALSLSADGLRLAVGTCNGSIGMLDVVSHSYTTLLRSHVGAVVALAIDPNRDECATVGADCTIRVWCLKTGQQKYEFLSPDDAPTCVAYAPTSVNDERHLGVGFVSGCLRVFDVPSTRTVAEFHQHCASILQVIYSPNGSKLYTAGGDGLLCAHSVTSSYAPVKMVAVETVPASNPIVKLCISPDSKLLAAIGLEAGAILVYNTSTLTLTRRYSKDGKKSPPLHEDLEPEQTGSGYNTFIYVSFSNDGCDIYAATHTRMLRFPVTSREKLAWSTPLPIKSCIVASYLQGSGEGTEWLVLCAPEDPTQDINICEVRRSHTSASVSLSSPQVFTGHYSKLTCADFSLNGKWVVTADSTGAVGVWKRRQNEEHKENTQMHVQQTPNSLHTPAISIALRAGALTLHAAEGAVPMRPSPHVNVAVAGLNISNTSDDNDTCVDGPLPLVEEMETSQELSENVSGKNSGDVNCGVGGLVAWNAANGVILCTDKSGSVFLYNVDSPNQQIQLTDPDIYGTSIYMSQDAPTILACTTDGSLRLWNCTCEPGSDSKIWTQSVLDCTAFRVLSVLLYEYMDTHIHTNIHKDMCSMIITLERPNRAESNGLLRVRSIDGTFVAAVQVASGAIGAFLLTNSNTVSDLTESVCIHIAVYGTCGLEIWKYCNKTKFSKIGGVGGSSYTAGGATGEPFVCVLATQTGELSAFTWESIEAGTPYSTWPAYPNHDTQTITALSIHTHTIICACESGLIAKWDTSCMYNIRKKSIPTLNMNTRKNSISISKTSDAQTSISLSSCKTPVSVCIAKVDSIYMCMVFGSVYEGIGGGPEGDVWFLRWEKDVLKTAKLI